MNMESSAPPPMDVSVPLRRRDSLTLDLDAAGSVTVHMGHQRIDAGPHGLMVLDVFSVPMTFGDALDLLSSRVYGVQDWMELAGAVTTLYDAGVLVQADDPDADAGGKVYGFDHPEIHVSMLRDHPRTQGFIDAIKTQVRPGDVVIDIGTGTGVLAVAAALAGARHVYAIESGAIGRAAEQMFADNGLAHKITLVSGWSTRIELPERADLLVSETLGNDPLDEAILESVLDARRRLLKPDARVIPTRVTVCGRSVGMPSDVVDRYTFSQHNLDNWQEKYGIRFEVLAEYARQRAWVSYLRPHEIWDWPALSEPVTLARIDLSDLDNLRVDAEAETSAARDGVINGVVGYFDAELCDGLSLTTDPWQVAGDSSWRNPVWILPQPFDVGKGDVMQIKYSFRGSGQRLECRKKEI